MRSFATVLFIAVFAVSSFQISPVLAKGAKKPADKDIKGTVSVKKSGTTVTSIEITADDKTVYEVKIDSKGEQLAKKYDGKSVEVMAKVAVVSGKKTLTIEKIVDDVPSKPKAKK